MKRIRSSSLITKHSEKTFVFPSPSFDDSSIANHKLAWPYVFTHFLGSQHMLQHRLGCIIQDGITETQRLALSSDLWRCATTLRPCDLLITVKKQRNEKILRELVFWIRDVIKKAEPNFDIKIRHHSLTKVYGLYITANYTSLLKGAELCHLKKPVKASFGGGMKNFTFDEAQCFQGLQSVNTFFTSMEKSMIVRQILYLIKAPSPGKFVFGSLNANENFEVIVSEGSTFIVSLCSQSIIECMLPMHQSDQLSELQKNWVFAPLDSQPLDDVKNYFGTEIAMYFAWLGHLTTAFCAPATIGIIMYCVGGFKFSHDDNQSLFSDICFVLFALVNCIWSTTYLEMWKRQQAELAFKWGTYELQNDDLLDEPRPAFKGDFFAPNPVTGRLQQFSSFWKQAFIRYCIGYPITGICFIIIFLTVFCLLQLQDIADHYFGDSFYFQWIPYVPVVIYAFIIQSGDFLYRKLAIFLNDLENYRTDDEYESYLIQKVVLYQCVSAFGSLFYIAFYLNDMKRLQETLATLLITRQLMQNVLEIAVPVVYDKFKVAKLTYQLTRSMSDHSLQKHVEAARKRYSEVVFHETGFPLQQNNELNVDGNSQFLRHRTTSLDNSEGTVSPRTPVNTDSFEVTDAELQSLMAVYARPLDDYLEMFIEFGYVLLFSPAFPLAAACALINNLIEIRVDAFKLCNTVQRPFGRRVKSIGAWQKAMELMGIAGVVVNCALIGQSGLVQRVWPNMSYTGQIFLIVFLEHLVLAVKAGVNLAIPDIPLWVRIETARVEHFRREAFKKDSRLLENNNIDKMDDTQDDHTVFNSRKNEINDKLIQRRRRDNHSCAPSSRKSDF